MKERIPGLVAIALLTTLVATTWWATDYTQRSVQVEAPPRLTHEPDSWSDNFVMIRTDADGKAVNRLDGKRMVHYPDDDSYEITTPAAVGQRPGSPITVGTAKTGIMDKGGSRIILRGDAHLHRPPYEDRPALDVTSQQLTFLPDEDLAFTDLPARVVNGKSVMNGKGMRYDNKTRTLQVFSASDVKISGQDTQSRQTTQKPAQRP